MTEYEFHELANIFPMLNTADLWVLANDIEQNGLMYPITLYKGKILDGRNRYEACKFVNVEPIYTEYTGNDPIKYVISLNLNRRQLNESQRAVVAERLANMKIGRNWESNSPNLDDKISLKDASDMLNVGRSSVANVRQIKEKAPEKLAQIESGEKTINNVLTEIKREEAIQRLREIESQPVKEIDGKYDVVVIDPPWQMEKIERDVAPNQTAFDYPTMNEQELSDLIIPCNDSCHVWLWTTHKFLPMAFRLLERWGMKYVCTFVWHKNGGFQPFGLPQYNCEFALYARIGTPIFTETKSFNTCFDAVRGEHSEKPEEFYDVVRRVTAGRRLDMFNRRKIDGFDTWGKEAYVEHG